MAEPGLRLFVALELPADVRDGLRAWALAVAGAQGSWLRCVPAESLHVTLCFLGWVAPDRAAAVPRACEVARGASVGELRVSRALWLPRRRPRVLTVELEDPEGRLSSLQGELAGALSAIGAFEPEGRPFLPHVTVARVGRGGRGRTAKPAPPPSVGFAAQRIVLYRSHLGGGPARYEALHEVPLSQG